MSTTIRNPAVAGQFYPGTKDSLLRQLGTFVDMAGEKEDTIGLVSPHAGYMYSGSVAGQVFSLIKPKSTYIIMGPNHTGLGEVFGISRSEAWKTPLGEVKIDRALADRIIKNCALVKEDDISHEHEHSIEVQLPFLQFLGKSFKFVPMVVSYAPVGAYQEVGSALAKSIRDMKLEKDVVIIASSDMTHYEEQESAKKKDSVAIDAILELDAEKLIDSVSRDNITMCGYAPTAIMITAANMLGAKKAKLVRYQTSGDVSGDYSSVVGYAGIIIT